MTGPAIGALVLHPTAGDAVLARREGLVLLCSAPEELSDTVDALVAAHAAVAAQGGDGAALADALAGILAAGSGELDVVVLGPSGPSLLVAVYGHAWVSVTTEHGEQNLAMRRSRDGVRSVLPGRLVSVRGGLGDLDPAPVPQRWASLDAGVVRAGGLLLETTVAVLADPPVADPPVAVEPVAVEPVAVVPAVPPADTADHPILPDLQQQPVPPDPEPPVMPMVAPPAPSIDRSQEFSSVVLVAGAGALAEAPARAPLPVITAPPAPPAPDVAPADHPADEGRPQVLGVYCKNGHFDDPAARYCAICGISMAQLTLVPRPGPRPPLGVLVLDDGSIFSLDTDYVLGRDPSQDPDVLAGTARALRFDDPEGVLSRRHARIVLDGWQVQVVDLGSANGTGVWGPGESAWHQIPPRTPLPIRPGTQLGLGRRHLRYESHRNT